MRDDTRTSAAFERMARPQERVVKAAQEEETAGITLELVDHYKKITGNDIAPTEVLKHLAHSDVKIYGEQSAAAQESHAQDALDMSELAPQELKLPMLFHDIGKAGPDHTDLRLSRLVANMYAYNFPYKDRGRSPKEVGITEFLESMIEHVPGLKAASLDSKENFILRLVNMLKLPDDASMRDFYDAHIQWGVDLQEKSQFIDKPTAFAAFGHHILPGVMPWDIEAIRSGKKQMGHGIAPFIREFVPSLEDIKLAAGAQTLDYCNARFTRSDTAVADAAKQTRDALFFAIDNGGYTQLVDTYKEEGVEIALTEDDILEIKKYIEKILAEYQRHIEESEKL